MADRNVTAGTAFTVGCSTMEGVFKFLLKHCAKDILVDSIGKRVVLVSNASHLELLSTTIFYSVPNTTIPISLFVTGITTVGIITAFHIALTIIGSLLLNGFLKLGKLLGKLCEGIPILLLGLKGGK